MINITVVAGKGGNGCVSLAKRRKGRGSVYLNRFDGSDGGDGGDVWLLEDSNLNTLSFFSSNRFFRAGNGQIGRTRGCTGKRGQDVIIKVPWGTRVSYQKTNKFLGEIGKNQKSLIVAKGGRHGLGGRHCAYSTASYAGLYKNNLHNRSFGALGEFQRLSLNLALISDVGLVGLPNSGKSSFVRIVSAAKPKVSDYPFTTLIPKLGVVQVDQHNRFVIADIPGIIKGASNGLGLGLRFLKHLERCRILLHFVDIAPIDNSNPIANIIGIEQELSNYGNNLVCKPRWLVFNKIDLLDQNIIEKKIQKIIQSLQWVNRYYFISSMYSTNISLLCHSIINFIKYHD